MWFVMFSLVVVAQDMVKREPQNSVVETYIRAFDERQKILDDYSISRSKELLLLQTLMSQLPTSKERTSFYQGIALNTWGGWSPAIENLKKTSSEAVFRENYQAALTQYNLPNTKTVWDLILLIAANRHCEFEVIQKWQVPVDLQLSMDILYEIAARKVTVGSSVWRVQRSSSNPSCWTAVLDTILSAPEYTDVKYRTRDSTIYTPIFGPFRSVSLCAELKAKVSVHSTAGPFFFPRLSSGNETKLITAVLLPFRVSANDV